MAKRIDVEGLNVWFGSFQALKDISITVEPKLVDMPVSLARQ